ncbi:MAG TPA: substrate-binding domain-containing protein [Tepidisphaeraceae bacterium]|jgi:LacI family transcriptional regulator|nr:substrate-binding domain-containing protein [Tepidisphaeraceae bacterium]
MIETHTSYGQGLLRGISSYVANREQWVAEVPNWDNEGVTELTGADGVIAQVYGQHDADRLRAARVPVVNVSSHATFNDLPAVRPDNHAAGRLGAEHLLDRGFRSFAFCGIPERYFSGERQAGFCQRIEAHGHPCQTFGWPHYPPPPDRRPLVEWVASLPKPVGLMAANDLRARHLAIVARDAGLRVPEEMALLGVDNDPPLCELNVPPTSSIVLPTMQLGYEAAALLDRLIAGEPAPVGQLLLPPVGIVTRRSTDILAIDDPEIAVAVRLIHERVGRGPLRVRHLLDELAMSRRSLEVRFTQALGRSPAFEIRRVQLERARRLLVETDEPMPVIAKACGFSSGKQFGETFQEQLALTPTAYRKQFRLNAASLPSHAPHPGASTAVGSDA